MAVIRHVAVSGINPKASACEHQNTDTALLRFLDLGAHAGADPVAYDPQLVAGSQSLQPQLYTELTLSRIVVIQELRIVEVRGDRITAADGCERSRVLGEAEVLDQLVGGKDRVEGGRTVRGTDVNAGLGSEYGCGLLIVDRVFHDDLFLSEIG